MSVCKNHVRVYPRVHLGPAIPQCRLASSGLRLGCMCWGGGGSGWGGVGLVGGRAGGPDPSQLDMWNLMGVETESPDMLQALQSPCPHVFCALHLSTLRDAHGRALCASSRTPAHAAHISGVS